MILFFKKTHDKGTLEGLTTLNIFFAGNILGNHYLLNYPILPLSIDFSYRRKKRILDNLIHDLGTKQDFCYNCHSCLTPCGKKEPPSTLFNVD